MSKRKKESGRAVVGSTSGTQNPDSGIRAPAPWTRWFTWAVLGAAGILALWAFLLMSSRTVEVDRLAAQGWGNYAAVIVANKLRALWHAAFMSVCIGLLFFFRFQVSGFRFPRLLAWVPVLLVAADALLLSRHYVKTMPMSAVAENPVISILKKDMPERRVALLSQDGFYNSWLTYLFPYHGIQAVNVTQMPRMPADYKNFLEAVTRYPIRYWQLSAVGYVLAPAAVMSQIQKDPDLQAAFDIVYRYNAIPAEGGVGVVPDLSGQSGQHVVLRLKKPAPRFALIAGWQKAADEEALRLLGWPTFPLFEKVLVAPESAAGLPESGGTGVVGRVRLAEYLPGYRKLEVEADRAAMLHISEKYEASWTAAVDGQPAPLRRVDYLLQGVFVPPGRHEVTLRYVQPLWPLAVQSAGMLICLGAIIWLVAIRLVRRSAPAAEEPANVAGSIP